jgi:hypothetical protein
MKSPDIFLFHCQEKFIQSIVLKALDTEVNFMEKEGLQWLSDNLFTDTVEIHLGKKDYEDGRNTSIFDLIIFKSLMVSLSLDNHFQY